MDDVQTSPCITLAASPSIDEVAARLVHQAHERWPNGQTPTIRRITLDSLLERLRPWNDGGRRPIGEVLVVAIAADETPLKAFRIRDALSNSLAPALLMYETFSPEHMSDSAPMPVTGLDIDPSIAAAMLSAICSRQNAVDTLRKHWQIAAHLQTGMHGDMDRLHEELTLAASVQREWLPRELPRGPSFEFGVLFRPAGYVSGDIYDARDLGDGRYAFFVADAMGHGVPAALMTLMIARSLHRRHEFTSQFSPDTALENLNTDLIQGQHGRARFATAVCGVIDANSGRVQLACAGHPPPVIAHAGRLTPVAVDGPLLGVFPKVRYESVELMLTPGQTLMLYSDGFEAAFAETAKARDLSSLQGFLDILGSLTWPAQHSDSPGLSSTLEDLARILDAQAGSLHQADDVTALGISVRCANRVLAAA